MKLKMLSWLKRVFKKLKKKSVKPIKNPKEIEIVCQGFYPAPDVVCVSHKMNEKDENGK